MMTAEQYYELLWRVTVATQARFNVNTLNPQGLVGKSKSGSPIIVDQKEVALSMWSKSSGVILD